MILFQATSRKAVCLTKDAITVGSVGLTVRFALDGWEAAPYRVAVFHAGTAKADVALVGESCAVPADVLAVPGVTLIIGVYGTNGDGTLVIPTVYAEAGRIQAGAVPTNVTPSPQTQPLIDQLLAAAEAAQETAQSVRDDADAGEFDGKTAYEYAVEGGYSGTEAQFAADLALIRPAVTTYVHNQNVAAAEWRIEHGLGKYPAVTVVDSGGTEVVGEVVYLDENTVECRFNGAFSGSAYLN